MNILFNCSEYPPTRNGGIGSVTKIVAEELAKRDHKVYVVGNYPELPARKKEEVINGVNIIRYNVSVVRGHFRIIYPYLNKLRLLGPFIQRELSSYENKIQTIVEKKRINILELTDYYGFNRYNCRLKYNAFNVPTVIRIHGSITFMKDNEGKSTKYSYYNDLSHFQRAQYLSSVSRYSIDYVEERFDTSHYIEKKVIYNPIEDRFLKHNNPSDNKIIIYIGRLTEKKGAYSTINAFNKLVEHYPDWELRMLGIGDQIAASSLLTEASRENVKFLGFCTREVVEKEIVNSAFACVPSYFESFSMVPLEIMAQTRCLIYTNRTSGKEIIEDGVDGYVVEPENTEEIYKLMEKLVCNPNVRNTFAERAYKKLKNRFAASKIVGEIEEFYQNIAKQ